MLVAIVLHLLTAVIWVGGMFFAYMALRPVAAQLLEPPLRLPLWVGSFARFFPWVWASILLLPVTGYWLMFARFGGFAQAPVYVHLMQGLGIVMFLIFLHVFFAPYARLRRAVAQKDWPSAGKALGQIRLLIGTNLLIGLIVIAIAAGGRYVV